MSTISSLDAMPPLSGGARKVALRKASGFTMFFTALIAMAGGLNWGATAVRMWKDDEEKKIAECHDLLQLLGAGRKTQKWIYTFIGLVASLYLVTLTPICNKNGPKQWLQPFRYFSLLVLVFSGVNWAVASYRMMDECVDDGKKRGKHDPHDALAYWNVPRPVCIYIYTFIAVISVLFYSTTWIPAWSGASKQCSTVQSPKQQRASKRQESPSVVVSDGAGKKKTFLSSTDDDEEFIYL